MAYLLDSSILMDAKDEYYGFDFCPAFWDWIDLEHSASRVFSIDKVKEEICAGDDELSEWAKAKGKDFFLPIDLKAIESLKRVAVFVQSLPERFSPTKKRIFMKGADPILIAFALAHNHTIVTSEDIVNPDANKIKIPNIANFFEVPVVRTSTMLRQMNASFHLKSTTNAPEDGAQVKVQLSNSIDILTYRGKLEEIEREIENKQKELDSKKDDLEETQEELDEVVSELEQKTFDLNTVKDELEALRKEVIEIEADLNVPD